MKRRGMTLIETAVVLAVVGLVVTLALPTWKRHIERLERSREERALEHLEGLIVGSFRDPAWTRNIAALPGTLGSQEEAQLTEFSSGGESLYVATASAWFVKLARREAIPFVEGGVVDAAQQPALAGLANHRLERARWLFLGPREEHQQRYILLSLLAPLHHPLVLPEAVSTAEGFEHAWAFNWDMPVEPLPPAWLAQLTAEQQRAWREACRGVPEGRMVARKIVQPKHVLVINNTHPTSTLWLDLDGQINRATVLPNSAPLQLPPVLEGRLVVVRRGPMAPGVEAYRFFMNEPTSITAQP